LLEQDPLAAEAASEQVGPSDVILRRHEKREARFMVASGHVEEGTILQSAFDASHEDRLEVWLGVEFG
jgi:hypothetical protein